MVPIHSELSLVEEPRWLRRTVERLLSSVPEARLRGLGAIVLTSTEITRNRRGGRAARRNRRGIRLGAYHGARQGEPGWIELVVDQLMNQLPSPLDKITLAREMTVGRVLFHEIGHHIAATIGSVGRTGEDSARTWEKRLMHLHIHARYSYLRPLVPVISRFAGFAKFMARRGRLRRQRS